MKCPYCLHTKTRVVDKRNITELGSIRRRRECRGCGQRFTTYERIELTGLSVMKKDGRRETFDRGKLVTNILKACEKRPIPRARVEEMVSEIEAELRGSGEPEIPVHLIGEVVMKKLKTLDKVAYIRFASVYREFEDIESFERELESLK